MTGKESATPTMEDYRTTWTDEQRADWLRLGATIKRLTLKYAAKVEAA